MPSTVLKCGKATKFNAHSLPQIPQCHLASSFNVTDEPPIVVSKLLNLAVHWPSKVWPVGMIARKRRECLKFNTPLNVSFQKSTKVFPYYSISVINSTFFIRLFDEHFARHFESHWCETWRHTGKRTEPPISLKTPPPSRYPEDLSSPLS